MKNIQQQKRKNEIEKETKKTIIELIHHFYITTYIKLILFLFLEMEEKRQKEKKRKKNLSN